MNATGYKTSKIEAQTRPMALALLLGTDSLLDLLGGDGALRLTSP